MITLVAACRKYGHHPTTMRAAAESGLLRYIEMRPWGRGVSVVFNERELAEDIAALPECRVDGCAERALAARGHCRTHSGTGGLSYARRQERALLAADRDWYTGIEAARIACCARATLMKAVADGELHPERHGRLMCFPRAELRAWAATRRRRPPVPRPTADERAARRREVARLHAEGLSRPAIARELDCSVPTVVADLEAVGLPGVKGLIVRRLPEHERARRREEAKRLYEAGRTLGQVAEALDSSPTQIGRDLRVLGVQRRSAGPPVKYSPVEESRCRHCGQAFTPRFPSYGARRFCSDPCARAARALRLQRAVAERGLSISQVAERLGVGERRVGDYIRDGRLAAEEVRAEGMLRSAFAIRPEEVARFEREWARTADSRRLHWLGANGVEHFDAIGHTARLAETLGLSEDQARAIVRARIEDRRARVLPHRAGRRRQAPSPRYLRWGQRYTEIRSELEEAYRRDLELGLERDGPPTRWAVVTALAERDWAEHPEDWPREGYPASSADPGALAPKVAPAAANRIATALKSLQTTHREITAA